MRLTQKGNSESASGAFQNGLEEVKLAELRQCAIHNGMRIVGERRFRRLSAVLGRPHFHFHGQRRDLRTDTAVIPALYSGNALPSLSLCHKEEIERQHIPQAFPSPLCFTASDTFSYFRYALPPEDTSSERFAPTFSSRRRLEGGNALQGLSGEEGSGSGGNEIRGTRCMSLPLEGKVPSVTRRMRWPGFGRGCFFLLNMFLCTATGRFGGVLWLFWHSFLDFVMPCRLSVAVMFYRLRSLFRFRCVLPPEDTSSERFAPTFSSRRRLEGGKYIAGGFPRRDA